MPNTINIKDYYQFRIGKNFGKDGKKALNAYAKSKGVSVKEMLRLLDESNTWPVWVGPEGATDKELYAPDND